MKRRMVGTLMVFAACTVCRGQTAPSGTAGTGSIKRIAATIPTEPWEGWGRSAGATTQPAHGPTATQNKCRVLPTPEGDVPRFVGRVIGLQPGERAEIGLVSFSGVYWTSNKNFEWFPLAADGKFELSAESRPDVPRTIVVKSDRHPWTYLNADFAPKDSAVDIVLELPPCKPVKITVIGGDGKPARQFNVEVFNAYEMTDAAGNELEARRMGQFPAANGVVATVLPLEPVAVLIGGPKLANHYQIIDPREADQFEFTLLAESRITGKVVKDGKTVAKQRLMIYNDASPLSATMKTTDASGKFVAERRVPGTDTIEVGGRTVKVQLEPGKTTDVTIDLDQPRAE